jgi:hypothetical protein
MLCPRRDFYEKSGDGGLTSSSDARAHQAIALRTFLVQGLCLVVAFSAIHAARDQQQKTTNRIADINCNR